MLVREARAVAAAWVTAHAGSDAGFRGAFLTGSAAVLPLDAPLPPTSDVDVTVVVAGPVASKPGKLLVDGVLLDVTRVPESTLAGAATSWVWAPSFRGGQILADPTGWLARLEAQIAPGYASPPAVAARARDVQATIRRRLTALDPARPWPDLVTAWLFPTSLTAVLACVAAGGTPTVRLRYLRARDVLEPTAYAVLLRLLGCADVLRAVVERHLDDLDDRVAEAGRLIETPFPFTRDLAPAARPVTIDGSRALVAAGDHREAVFWTVATAARCQQVLAADAPALARVREPGFRALVADLTGLHSVSEVLGRRDEVLSTIGSTPPAVGPRASRRR